MLRIAHVVLSAALLATLAVHAPGAAAMTCDVSPNPLPPAPVGGTVGAVYTLETNTAWSAFTFAFFTGCDVAGFGLGVVNQHCAFYLGAECLPLS